jgi:hypothetical protein
MRDRQAKRLRGLEVDDQLKFGGLLHREIGGFGALEYLVDVGCSSRSGRWASTTAGTGPARMPRFRIAFLDGFLLHRDAFVRAPSFDPRRSLCVSVGLAAQKPAEETTRNLERFSHRRSGSRRCPIRLSPQP